MYAEDQFHTPHMATNKFTKSFIEVTEQEALGGSARPSTGWNLCAVNKFSSGIAFMSFLLSLNSKIDSLLILVCVPLIINEKKHQQLCSN